MKKFLLLSLLFFPVMLYAQEVPTDNLAPSSFPYEGAYSFELEAEQRSIEFISASGLYNEFDAAGNLLSSGSMSLSETGKLMLYPLTVVSNALITTDLVLTIIEESEQVILVEVRQPGMRNGRIISATKI